MAQRSKDKEEERIEREGTEEKSAKKKSKSLTTDTTIHHQILKKALDNFEDAPTKDQYND